ncbi:ABC transporter permease [Thermocrispum sp.]|uniref:ABC transporter permease n=1 Tax=Thermocrispum agreste TaxID=37925 RepID=A0A2W4JLI3_9PSEU|nr:ABC transporter permease [Thermocrispum sp.]PZM99960.1 MAG: ABC transporter permease [Thermocrispum agreste]
MTETATRTEPERVEPDSETVLALRRNWGPPIAYLVLGLLALLVFGIFAEGGKTATFGLSTRTDAIQLDPLAVPAKPTSIVLAVGCLLATGYAFRLTSKGRRTPLWLPIVFGILFVLSFLSWAVGGAAISLTGLLQGALALAVPFIFGALCGMVGERSGVINIAIDGQLLFGAFLSGVVASLSGNLWVGLIAAPIAGVMVAWLLAIFTIKYFVNQIIVGVVLNVLVYGVTNFLYGSLLGPEQETWNSPGKFGKLEIPLLSDIPVIGPVLFNQTIIVYVMYVVVAVVHVALFHTRWGLRVRAVGEHPEAADTAGIDVNSVRFRNVLIGGAIAGFGGAFFTLAQQGIFSKEMTAGAGFIALAAMIMGRWTPIGAVFAALLIGFADNLQSVLGIIGFPIPSELMAMTPYLLTILAVAGLVGRIRPPAANGVPYIKS